MLVKALLINGATALAEWDTTDDQDDDPNNIPLKHPPDYKQGFGRVQLNTVLPLGTTSFDLFVSDRQALTTNATHNLTYHVTDSSIAFQTIREELGVAAVSDVCASCGASAGRGSC